MVGISILPNGFKAGSGLDCFVASNPFKKNNRCEPSNPLWLKIDAVALIETTNLADSCQLTPRNGCRIGSISLTLPPRYLTHIFFIGWTWTNLQVVEGEVQSNPRVLGLT
jgi:hypothetical protein